MPQPTDSLVGYGSIPLNPRLSVAWALIRYWSACIRLGAASKAMVTSALPESAVLRAESVCWTPRS